MAFVVSNIKPIGPKERKPKPKLAKVKKVAKKAVRHVGQVAKAVYDVKVRQFKSKAGLYRDIIRPDIKQKAIKARQDQIRDNKLAAGVKRAEMINRQHRKSANREWDRQVKQKLTEYNRADRKLKRDIKHKVRGEMRQTIGLVKDFKRREKAKAKAEELAKLRAERKRRHKQVDYAKKAYRIGVQQRFEKRMAFKEKQLALIEKAIKLQAKGKATNGKKRQSKPKKRASKVN